MQTDIDYFARRAREERQRAADATDKGAAAAHRYMAAEYERLGDPQIRRSLRMAGNT